jgi:hypothetical protein
MIGKRGIGENYVGHAFASSVYPMVALCAHKRLPMGSASWPKVFGGEQTRGGDIDILSR